MISLDLFQSNEKNFGNGNYDEPQKTTKQTPTTTTTFPTAKSTSTTANMIQNRMIEEKVELISSSSSSSSLSSQESNKMNYGGIKRTGAAMLPKATMMKYEPTMLKVL